MSSLAARLVPKNAKTCQYQACRGMKAQYWLWQNKQGKWYWVALGNNGEEATEMEARTRAVRWIRDGN